MTDVEKWIFGHSEEVQDNTGALVSAIRTEDIEDLLSRFTLCEREPSAWMHDVGHVIAASTKESVSTEKVFDTYNTPLYAPARIEND